MVIGIVDRNRLVTVLTIRITAETSKISFGGSTSFLRTHMSYLINFIACRVKKSKSKLILNNYKLIWSFYKYGIIVYVLKLKKNTCYGHSFASESLYNFWWQIDWIVSRPINLKLNEKNVHIKFVQKKNYNYILENRVFALLHIHQSVQQPDQKYCSQNQLNNFL